MTALKVQITITENGKDLPLPQAATAGAAGLDLVCASMSEVVLPANGGRALVPTGIKIAVPRGWEAQIRARSGLALDSGICLANGIGTIDSDYRGEVKVILINLGEHLVRISRGARIAQLVFAPVAEVIWDNVIILSETPRGDGGFGHTG